MKYSTTKETTYYMASGNVRGKYPIGKIFESSADMTIREMLCRNITGTKEYIPAENCKEYVEETPPVDLPPNPETFSAPVDLMSRWETGLDNDGQMTYSDWYRYHIAEDQ